MNKISKIIIIVIAIITFLRVSCRSPAETKYQFKDDKLRSSREENSFRDYIKTNLNNRLDPKISGLAVAYLVGDKSGLSSSLKEEISENRFNAFDRDFGNASSNFSKDTIRRIKAHV